MFGLDGSGWINVQLNNKGLAQVRIGQYAQAFVPKGHCAINLQHRDLGYFYATYEFDFTNDNSFVEIHATPTSNEALLVPNLPDNFEWHYKPVK